MNRKPTKPSSVRLEEIWKFVRGDAEPTDFAQWVYTEPDLEEQLGEALYLEALIADYSNKAAVYDLRESLEAYARDASKDRRCECITLPDLVDRDMGEDSDTRFRTLEERAVHGPPLWWLAAYQCPECEQWWLLAQESRINDVDFLKRISSEESEQILMENQWPEDFDKFETLLRLGRERGHRVTYLEPLTSLELFWTTVDLALERPGIRVSELAELLNLDVPIARQIAKEARRKERVVIDFEHKNTLFKRLRNRLFHQ